MNGKTKIAIFLVAVVISLVGFNLLVPASAVDLAGMGKAQENTVYVTVTAERGSSAQPVVHIAG